MNSAKRYLVIALSFAICMTVFAAFAPSIAHAVTATLVQVVNNSSSPVPVVRQDGPGKNSVRLYFSDFTTSDADGGDLNDFSTNSPYVVPAGKRLVLDVISSRVSVPSGQSASEELARFGQPTLLVPLQAQGEFSGGTLYVNALSVPKYYDAGETPHVGFERNSSTGFGLAVEIYVDAHLVDCC